MTSPEPGGEIHEVHPFADPAGSRSPLRQFRGRLPTPVTLWTAYAEPRPTGLTVASTQVADGRPGLVSALLDPDSDLYDALVESDRFAVALLAPRHRDLADRFGGMAPSPGGLFRGGERWRDTDWGPVLEDAASWAGCRVRDVVEAGWSRRVTGVVEDLTVGDDEPLLYYRGRYRVLAPPSGG